jgi:hypothetical protein
VLVAVTSYNGDFSQLRREPYIGNQMT